MAAAALAIALTGLPTTLSAPQADAAPSGEAFYVPPDPLPDVAPGTVLRAERFPLALSVPGNPVRIPADATRLMYMSADTHGRPAPVTGTYMRSSQPWSGPGERPVVAVAPGTMGQGDQCAASKTFGELAHVGSPTDIWANYEVTTAYSVLARGMNVLMTDYHGLGTPPVHDYVNRKAEAYAVLDSLRAANNLTRHHPPSLIFGYSQGGGAAAAAAELHRSYAPDTDLRGVYAGAPPADLRYLFEHSPVANGVLPGVGGIGPVVGAYLINGLVADYPETRPAIEHVLNADGKRALADTVNTCVAEGGARLAFQPMSRFVTGNRPAVEELERYPEVIRRIDEQRIGGLEPDVPVLVAAGTNDDVISYDQVRQLVVDWCRQGAKVTFDTTSWIPPVLPSLAIGHVLEFLPALAKAQAWSTDVLANKPVAGTCDTLGRR